MSWTHFLRNCFHLSGDTRKALWGIVSILPVNRRLEVIEDKRIEAGKAEE